MGLKVAIAKVLSSLITETFRVAKTEFYPGYTKETRAFYPPGVDSAAVVGDQSLTMEVGTSGKTAFVGVIPESIVANGEIRTYSRSGGATVASIHHKVNGDIDVLSKTGGKVSINNDAEKLKTLLNDLITEIKDIVTIGSPSIHTIKPTTQVKLTEINTRINNLFKD